MDRTLKDKAHFIISQTIWNNKNGKAVFTEQTYDRCLDKFQDEINAELYKLIEEGGGGGQGKPGKTPVLIKGIVTTLPAGSDAQFDIIYVEDNIEGNPVYRIDMGLPRGDKGDTGSAGKDGIDGNNGIDGKDGKDGTNGTNGSDGLSAGFGNPTVVTETLPSTSLAEVIVTANGPDQAKIFNFHFKIPKGKDGSGGGGEGVDGKTPIMQIGVVTTIPENGLATANVRLDGEDISGNPIYKIDLGLPIGATGINGTDGLNGIDGVNGVDGKTPIFQIGNVITIDAGGQATANIRRDGQDIDNNPIYKVDLGIPKGQDGSGGGTSRGRVLFTLENYSTAYRPEIGLSKILPAITEFNIADCVIDKLGTVREVTAVSLNKDTANLSDIIYTFSSGGEGNYATQDYVNTQIESAIGVINTMLDELNGEVI